MMFAREDEIREALITNPALDDRTIARLLGIRRWSKVTRVRAALVDPAPPPPPKRTPCPQCDFVAKSAAGLHLHQARRHPPALPVIVEGEAEPALSAPPVRGEIRCVNCRRAGTPAPARPNWCVACAASPAIAATRASWDDPDWQCACGRAFVRSTQEPARCIKCSGEYDRAAARHRVGGGIFVAAD